MGNTGPTARSAAIEVRGLTSADYDAVHALDIAIEREYAGVKAWDELKGAQQRDLLVTSPDELAICARAGFSLVAVADDRVIGFLLAFREPLPFARLYVWQVSVAAPYRRLGVAALMYTELVPRARAAGIQTIRANINLDNEASARLHERLGFTLTQRLQATLRL